MNTGIYLYGDFTPERRFRALYHGKGNILEKHTDESGRSYCRFERTCDEDFHLDVSVTDYPGTSLVYECTLLLQTEDVRFHMTFKSRNAEYFTPFAVRDGILLAGDTQTKLDLNRWYTVSTVYSTDRARYALYIDGSPVAAELEVPAVYQHRDAAVWRFHVRQGPGEDRFLVGRMAVYAADAPDPSFTAPDKDIRPAVVITDYQRAYPSDAPQREYLRDKVAYHPRSGVLTVNGRKSMIPPVSRENPVTVPLSFFTEAFGTDVLPLVKENSAGRTSVPLIEFAETVLHKYTAVDTASVSSGMILLSDSPIDLSDAGDVQKLSDFALYLRPDADRIRRDYEASPLCGVHPRVLACEEDFVRVRALAKTDESMKQWADETIARAEKLMERPKLIYELRDGVRLWFVSMDLIEQMLILGMAYHLTKDKRYAERAWLDLESVAQFPTWHPEHHIDVGGLALGFGIGYDWFYHAFTPEQRALLEEGAYNNGYTDYIDGYQGRERLMMGGIMAGANHNMVMNAGGAALGAAFFDVYPTESAYCIAESVRCLEAAIYKWAPQGSWLEGVGYGGMTVEYMTYQFAVLKTLFGQVYTLDCTEGVDLAARFFLHMQGTLGSFPFGDCSGGTVTYDPGSLWLCDHYGDYATISAYKKLFGIRGSVRTMLWYRPEQMNSPAELPLDMVYYDQNVMVVRDSWDTEKTRVFAGIKGGSPAAPHGHQDVGKFEFYSDGVRWTYDPGTDDYNLPGYWGCRGLDGPRWHYYRMRAESHSTLIIDPDERAEFLPEYNAGFLRTEMSDDGALGILDLTESHYGKAKKVLRGAWLADGRQTFVVRDEVTLEKESTLYWTMLTTETVEVVPGGKKIILRSRENPSVTVTLDFASNVPLALTAGTCVPLPTSPKYPTMKLADNCTQIRLTVRASGQVNITAKFTPGSAKDAAGIEANDIPLETWKIRD